MSIDLSGRHFLKLLDYSPEEITAAAACGLTLTVCTPEHIALAEAAARDAGTTLDCHLKLDTGMGRIGARDAEDVRAVLYALKAALTTKTKAVIINSPNNPSGMVYSEETLKELAAILKAHEETIGETVYLLTDEPYRELVYDMDKTPNAMCYYDDTFICYSFSKCMSIPGERIGYLAVSPRMHEKTAVYAAVLGAGRALGYINPPSLFQRVIERTVGAHSDFSQYKINRDLLTAGLREIGYECVDPKGAFYLFAKALEPDAKAFCEHAKKYELLLVPSNDFGMTGYFRMAYCVNRDMIAKSMPAFRALWDDYHK